MQATTGGLQRGSEILEAHEAKNVSETFRDFLQHDLDSFHSVYKLDTLKNGYTKMMICKRYLHSNLWNKRELHFF